jgi:hypothetical protein
VVFHLPCHQGASPGLLGEVILADAYGQFDPEEGLVPGELQDPAKGMLPIRLVRTWV